MASARIAQRALDTGEAIPDLVVHEELLSAEQVAHAQLLAPDTLTSPRELLPMTPTDPFPPNEPRIREDFAT